jgi:alpha-L-fucosidase
MNVKKSFLHLVPLILTALASIHAEEEKSNAQSVAAEHSGIGLVNVKDPAAVHTSHPDAQWYPEAGLGLFLHWSISSVQSMNISWPMIPGKNLRSKHITDPAERDRMIREKDFDLNGKPWPITPNQYWAMAADFNPRNYDPEKWCAAAKAAGMTYMVLTSRHHDGFALWPSAFGDFNTKNFMGGRDLVKPFVDACHKHGLKVGLYYSPPDWYFERDFKDFFSYARQKTPEFPALDADLKPRTETKSPQEIAAHHQAYDAMVKGQVEELLTRYGKIDLLWFDGCQPTPNGARSITAERIRELQPGIVINPRLHGKGDFITYERELKTNKVATTWAEFCNTWALLWTYDTRPFRSNAFVLGQLATCRSLGINYLLGIGPDAQGEFHPKAYENMAVVAEWMNKHRPAVHAAKPLPKGESASVPATALGDARFLFAIPHFKGTNGKEGMFDHEMEPVGELILTLKGQPAKPSFVTLLGDGLALDHQFSDGVLTITLPAARRTKLVDVVRVDR